MRKEFEKSRVKIINIKFKLALFGHLSFDCMLLSLKITISQLNNYENNLHKLLSFIVKANFYSFEIGKQDP